MGTALIIDDDTNTLLDLAEVFRAHGYATETSQNLAEARDALLRRMPDVAMINERVNGEHSLVLLGELDLSRVMEIYLMTEQRSLEVATRAMQLGVTDYFEKPIDTARLVDNLESLSSELHSAGEPAGDKSGRGLLVGDSASMQRLSRVIRKVAPSEASVLLAGESGTGKELAAQTIHALSARAAGPFVALNCSAVTSELMESELFGHIKGSFTGATRNHRGYFERAGGGTLFLDEITEMAAPLQAKLLRALESRSVTPVGGEKDIAIDVRIVAATNREPQQAVDDGTLREDLYFRIAQLPIRVPPLRERREDVALLAHHFLEEQNNDRGVVKTLGDDALDVFRLHDWPGNVRELRNAIMHGHLLAGSEITAADLPDHMPSTMHTHGQAVRTQIGMSLAEVERRHLLATLAYYDGDKKKAARILGISLKTLYNRLKQYEVS